MMLTDFPRISKNRPNSWRAKYRERACQKIRPPARLALYFLMQCCCQIFTDGVLTSVLRDEGSEKVRFFHRNPDIHKP